MLNILKIILMAIKPFLVKWDSLKLIKSMIVQEKIAASSDQIKLMGWVSYDFNRNNEFGWGGNFIAHDLKQRENGELYVEIVKEIDEKISNLQPLNTIDVYATINKNQEIVFNKEQLEYVVFDELMGVNKITGTLKINQLNNNFGIMFDYRLNQSSYFYELDYLNKQMQFNRGDILSDDLFKYTMNDLYINENEVDFTLLFEERTEADRKSVV